MSLGPLALVVGVIGHNHSLPVAVVHSATLAGVVSGVEGRWKRAEGQGGGEGGCWQVERSMLVAA